MPTPKVSVIVPVYNPGEYVHRCVKSLLGQTLTAAHYEVIFIDDGCTDGSAAHLDSLATSHRQVRVIHQENSEWPGRPRNVGLVAAQGDYAFFCDADDWLATNALESLYEHAVGHWPPTWGSKGGSCFGSAVQHRRRRGAGQHGQAELPGIFHRP
jgi:glycosyltransferase involved in cell wall biosynthesis